MALLNGRMRTQSVLFAIVCVLFYSGPACGINVLGEGGSSTERTTDIRLSCDAIGLNSDDELVRVTWYAMDQSHRVVSEIFSADLTNDHPAFVFSSNWAGRGIFDSGSLANIRLPSRHVTRDFAGEYRCQINSLMSSGFVDVNINILYGPGSSVVIAPGGRVQRQEGEELTLTCSSQCNPVCSYRWYRAGRQVSNLRVFVMSQLTRDKAGLYACQARNEAGRSIKPVDLRVSYPATILALNTSGASVDAYREIKNKGQVESNEDVVFTCEVKAWPEPNIYWIKNNAISVDNGSFSTTQMDLELKSSRFKIKSATCRDNGEYACKTWNNIGLPSSKSAVLNITCPPFETNHSKNCQQGNEINFIRNRQENLHLKICFFGNPTPNITVTQIRGQNDVIKTYVGNITCDFKMNHCESVFNFNITSPTQYGLYKIKISNSRGHFDKRFFVTSQQPPMLPLMFSVANISHNSACFSWKPNFNGGSKQKFSLKVYTLVKQNQDNDENAEIKELCVEEDESRTSIEDVFEYALCVPDLTPSTLYEAALSASNKFGLSESSNRKRFTTNDSITPMIPIPSWLSVAQVNTLPRSMGLTYATSSKKTHNPTERINPLMNLTTRKPHYPLEGYLNSRLSEDSDYEDNVDSEMDLSDTDDFLKFQFSQFLDSYFSLDKNNKLSASNPDDKSAKLSSKYASHLQRFFFNYATAQSHGFRPTSKPDPEPIVDDGSTASVFLSEAPLTTLSENPTASSSSSVYSVTVSTILVGASCVLGFVFIFGAIAFIKRKIPSNHCAQRCRQGNNNTRTPSSIAGSALQQSREQGTTNINISRRVPSITCVSNENASFSPPTGKRPRLSTPDIKFFRTKQTSNTSILSVENPSDSPAFSHHNLPDVLDYEVPKAVHRDVPTAQRCNFSTAPNHDNPTSFHINLSTSIQRNPPAALHRHLTAPPQSDLPTITLESTRGSCPSYLELNDVEKELPLQINNLGRHSPPMDTRRDNSQYLIPLSNRLSYSFHHHQTYSKNLADQDSDFSTSYLDLYEALATRSRSRSPSNIYDPFLFDVTESSGQTKQNGQFDENDTSTEQDTSLNNSKCFSISDTPVEEHSRTTDVTAAKEDTLVVLRTKSTPPRKTKKLTRPPFITEMKAVPDGSYELINPVSRKHLASRVCLPKTSNLNLDYVVADNFPNSISEISKNLQTKANIKANKEHRIDRKGYVNQGKFTKQDDHKYEYRIPLEFVINNPQDNSIMHALNKKRTIERNENSGNKNTNSRNETSTFSVNFLQGNKHLCGSGSKTENLDLRNRTGEIFSAQINNNISYISEMSGYVEEYTISALSRDSMGGISHGYCSIYSNKSEVRNSIQSNFSDEIDDPRSGKSSSESDQSINISGKISLDGSSTDQHFEISQSEYFEVAGDSTTAIIALRDSGVSCSYRHDSTNYTDNDAVIKNRLCDSDEFLPGSSSKDQVLYEEPFVPDNIYSEAFH